MIAINKTYRSQSAAGQAYHGHYVIISTSAISPTDKWRLVAKPRLSKPPVTPEKAEDLKKKGAEVLQGKSSATSPKWLKICVH